MDTRFLNYYNEELAYLRGVAGEFAAEFPKIAGRLGLDSFHCADPYVERLLEGFAFLAARVKLKLDDGLPRLAETVLETVFPQMLSPIPAMTIVEFQPDYTSSELIFGIEIPRHTTLYTAVYEDIKTPCRFSTAHPVTLYNLKLDEAKYLTRNMGNYLSSLYTSEALSALYFKLSTTVESLSLLKLNSLPFYIRSADELAFTLLEHISVYCKSIVLKAGDKEFVLPANKTISYPAFLHGNSLLPGAKRQYSGARLLMEYFTFPQRFLFFEIGDLNSFLHSASGQQLEIFLLLDKRDEAFAERVTIDNFKLFCTPAVNLFKTRIDRINFDITKSEFHLVKDRTAPMDFEIFSVEKGEAYDGDNKELFKIYPFYFSSERNPFETGNYFSIKRRPRTAPENKIPRSTYSGSEIFVSFAGEKFEEHMHEIAQIGFDVLCTNRDIPLLIPVGKTNTDFTCKGEFSLNAIKAVAPFSHPIPSPQKPDYAWYAVNNLRLNYLSICETEGGSPVEALQDMLKLYVRQQDVSAAMKQIEGIVNIKTTHVTRRLTNGNGPPSFAKGLMVTITMDEEAFVGTGCFLLAQVLHHFLAGYVTINSFVETVLETKQRSEVYRWEPTAGHIRLL